MQWWEVRVRVVQESVEALTALVQEWPEMQGVVVEGAVGVQPPHPEYGEWFDECLLNNQSSLVTVYVPVQVAESILRSRLAQVFSRLIASGLELDTTAQNVSIGVVDESDWEQAWKGEYHPISVGSRWVIIPCWDETEPAVEASGGRIPLLLEPGMAFGTGTHETTQLCLEALSDEVTPGMKILDVGCGTALLSIAAAKIGARQVVALDIDPVAVAVARENVNLNHVASIVTVFQADLLAGFEDSGFDVIVANILRDTVIALIPDGVGRLCPGGRMIVSGFVESQRIAVESAFFAARMQVVKRRRRGEWVTLEAKKSLLSDLTEEQREVSTTRIDSGVRRVMHLAKGGGGS